MLSYIESGRAAGATIATGGNAITNIGDGKGYFVAPTVFTNVKNDTKIWREEIFGPVAVISEFGDEEDAIRSANDTVYGLGAAVFTTNIERAHRVASEIEAGMVWVNSSQDCDPRVPSVASSKAALGEN